MQLDIYGDTANEVSNTVQAVNDADFTSLDVGGIRYNLTFEPEGIVCSMIELIMTI